MIDGLNPRGKARATWATGTLSLVRGSQNPVWVRGTQVMVIMDIMQFKLLYQFSTECLALPTGIMLDTNIFNRILDGKVSLDVFGKSSIYITHIQHDELKETKKDVRRRQLLEIFQVVEKKKIPTESAIFDISRFDECKFSDGVLLDKIKEELDKVEKKPNNTKDALIAETSIEKSLILVTEDRPLKEIVCRLNGKAMSLSDFCGTQS